MPSQLRREQLLAAARTLFLRHGVQAVSIEQITVAAQVAKGTFYLYFSSKDQLLTGLAAQFAAQLLQRIEHALASLAPNDWHGRLAAWSVALTEGYLKAKPLHDMLFYGARATSRAGATDNPIVDQLCALLEGGRRAGAWQIDDVRMSALFIFCALHGIVDDVVLREPKVHRSRLTRRLQRLCLRVVGHSA